MFPLTARKQIFIILIAVAAGSLLYFFYTPAPGSFHPKCPVFLVSGLHCPGCGSQRAFAAMIHGAFIEAASYNLLFVLMLPFIAWSAFVFSWNAFSKTQLRQRIFHRQWFVWSLLVVVILFTVLRNIPMFHWLAP